MTDDRSTDWDDERLAEAFRARSAAHPTPPDLASASIERVRASAGPRVGWLRFRVLPALVAALAVAVIATVITVGRPSVEPGLTAQPSSAVVQGALPILSVSEAIAVRDVEETDREIAVRGYFSPAPLTMRCVASGFVENPVRLECPESFQWLLDTPEPLNAITSVLPAGRIGFQPMLPFLDIDALARAADRAAASGSLVEVVFIGHFHDWRGHPNLCATGNEADCDGFVVDGIESAAGMKMPASVVVDLEPWAGMPRVDAAWTAADVRAVLADAIPDFRAMSLVALPGHRIRQLQPSLGTGGLGIIDRDVVWVVTGLEGGDGVVPVRRTFLLVDGTAEAYVASPESEVGFATFPLVLRPAGGPFILDLADRDNRHVAVEIYDESGLLVSAAPMAPGAWASEDPAPRDISVTQVAGRPNEIRIGWIGGACDGTWWFTIAPDARSISVDKRPSPTPGESFCILVGILRGVTLTFSEPVSAADIEIVMRPPEG
jgi:hypothetical protein